MVDELWKGAGQAMKNNSVCVCVCVKVCVCVNINWLKGGVVIRVTYCKMVHKFQMDSHTCTNLVKRLFMSQSTAD